jgi:hypothetical protein
MVLITYAYQRKGSEHNMFCYDIVRDVDQWLGMVKDYQDGRYILVNVLPITDEQAKKYEGKLNGM